jgi:hypothetical protein
MSGAAPGRVPAPRPTPRALTAVAVLVGLQGLMLVAVALYSLVALVVDTPRNVSGALGILVLAALGGVGLLAVARALLAARRWGRAPALVTQLIFIPVALGSFPDGWYVGGPLLVWALAVTVLLFVPPVSAVLDD